MWWKHKSKNVAESSVSGQASWRMWHWSWELKEWEGGSQVDRTGLGIRLQAEGRVVKKPITEKEKTMLKKIKEARTLAEETVLPAQHANYFVPLHLLHSCCSLGLECCSPSQSSAHLVQYLPMFWKFAQHLPDGITSSPTTLYTNFYHGAHLFAILLYHLCLITTWWWPQYILFPRLTQWPVQRETQCFSQNELN